MQARLVIELGSLPEEGKPFAGALSPEIFALPEGDAQPVGPLVYDIWAQRFDSELLLRGSLSAPFEFTCVVTLKPFVQTVCLENASISVEIGNKGEEDVTEALREEILISFPANPRCDEGDVPQACEIDFEYLSVDKSGSNTLPTSSRAGNVDLWSALDSLTDLKDQP